MAMLFIIEEQATTPEGDLEKKKLVETLKGANRRKHTPSFFSLESSSLAKECLAKV